MTAQTREQLRADARRNRDQILATARRIFAARGVEVPMEEIARAASVGVGTLYRRFPDREALVRAVAREAFADALTRIRAAVDEESSAWDALVRSLQHALDMRLVSQLMGRSVSVRETVKDDPDVAAHMRTIFELVDEVVAAAQDEGALRPDIGSGDILMLYSAVMARTSHLDEDVAHLATERSLAIVLDGMRAQPGSRLPGRQLTRADVGPRI